jgi:pyridoxamine 5'-phosphate oxidase
MRLQPRKDVHVTPSTPESLPDLLRMRREYFELPETALNEADLAPDWHSQFGRWLAAAVAAGLPEPNAMALATADRGGRPSVRHVLLKGYDERGLVFYTNYRSRKAVEVRDNPYASAVFPWFAMHRQVIVAGTVAPVDRAETEAYFALRPRDSQLGAWASPQSQVVAGREVLDEALREVARRWPEGTEIPAPAHWGGLRITPDSVEFWQGRVGRLHDRVRFRRTAEDWVVERLAP